MASNVILVEPNEVNINNDIVNGIPQYQDMHIFAELTAKSKGRTVIIDGDTNSSKSKKINFIGNNQDNENDNPNYLNFTTNYYDGSTGNGTHYEGFGINNIKIITNSSFIPQVNIQFVDIRGLAFFNQTDSPYRILFDFPPPIFTLTVKGQYGKPVTYDLHLVKYTSEFSAANGNFIIDAQFVAMTFAPLTDILFRYVVNTPLIDNEMSMNPKAGEKPKNTYELILKLKNLYTAISDKLETNNENTEYKNISDDINKIDLIMDMVSPSVISNNEGLNVAGTPLLVMSEPDNYVELQTNSIPDNKLTIIDDLTQFNDVIKTEQSSGIKDRIKHKLFILYVVASNIDVEDNTETPESSIIPSDWAYDSENDSNFETPLSDYKKALLAEKSSITSINISEDDIIDPESFLNLKNINIDAKTNTKYYGIDISSFYYKLYKKKVELEKDKTSISLELTRKINAMVEERLGMIPSIYNVFEIILNDVDTFFSTLKSTSLDAFNSHNNVPSNKKLILGDGSYSEKKDNTDVFAFPLIINTLNDREERVAPIQLQKKVDFPELNLVDDFINTFSLQKNYSKQLNIRENQGDDGTYKWIPISPFDSTLGGTTPESPYLGISDDVKTETLKILLKRFYMLSQGTLSEAFYPEDTDNRRKDKENIINSKAYQRLYSHSEAINLASTLINEKNYKILDVMTNEYINSIDNFYDDIENINVVYDNGSELITGSLYDFPKDDPKYFLITPSIPSEGRVYVDKGNQDFEGISIPNNDIYVQDLDDNSNNPVDNFTTDVKGGLFTQKNAETYFEFSEQNIIYLRDKVSETFFDFLKVDKNVINDGVEITTFSRYLTQGEYFAPKQTGVSGFIIYEEDENFPGSNNQSDVERQLIALNEGNQSFNYKSNSSGRYLDSGKDIIDVWGSQLGKYDTEIINNITGDTRLSSIIILSNFGFTASPFNTYINSLNSLVFDTPSAIEVPAYYLPYIGALITAIEDGWSNDIVDFFTGGSGQVLDNRGFYVLADLHDINLYLSENDKNIFKTAYDDFMRNYNDFIKRFKDLYNWVNDFTYDKPLDKINSYKYYLNSNAKRDSDIEGDKGQYFRVIRNLIVRRNIINYSQTTFKMSTDYSAGYTSLKELNDSGGTIEETNDNYFKSFFLKLRGLLEDIEVKAKEEAEELKKVSGDKDIINQLYYSFKNINDKWLTGNDDSSAYPFSKGKKLIDLFAFVDRGMNPIGETILNAEILGDMLDDPNISLFSVLSQLLSLNGFEFFPIQNFLRFDDKQSWENSFEIYNGGYDDSQNTYFVCMYVGGSSSYPSVSGNGFENDGIIDISEPGVKGFTSTTNNYEENVNQEKNENFPWREVRAFKVRFGEQNQSMFSDIKIDSKEYPETNESIQILSRLAGDQNPDVPVPKGQNLYNLYENRSYKATVTGFGNVMIQPTQYFQLENIPLFNGAYIILDVEHNITANKMTTSFSGTKLLKYPIPRVLDAISITDYEGASGGEATRIALTANLAKMMTPERVGNSTAEGGLESELGIDLSHHNGNVNWKEIKETDVKFTFIKLTEGETYYDGKHDDYDINKNISDALANDITVTYYHFARFGRTANPTTDGIDDATNFITHLDELSGLYGKPKLPVVLDLEEDSFNTGSAYKWGQISKPNESINEFTKAFIDEMEANDYDVMIYCRTDLIKKWDLTNYSKYPFWVARYMDLRTSNPETDEPTVPSEWKDGWTAWQFTPAGIIKGIGGDVDLNVMKKDFLNKYS